MGYVKELLEYGECNPEYQQIESDYWVPRLKEGTYESIRPFIKCVDKEMKIDGENIMADYKSIVVRFEPCTVYMDDGPSCSLQKTNEWLSARGKIDIFILFNGKQINLSNIDSPIETHYSYVTSRIVAGMYAKHTIDM